MGIIKIIASIVLCMSFLWYMHFPISHECIKIYDLLICTNTNNQFLHWKFVVLFFFSHYCIYIYITILYVAYSYNAPQNVRMNEPKDELIARSNVNLIFYKNLY